MASFTGHITFSSMLAAGYGGLAVYQFNLDWGQVFLGAGLTAAGGMLPDLDSSSGVPVREFSNLAAAISPFLLLHRFQTAGLTPEQTLVLLSGGYLFARYAVGTLFRKFTVHRGMFHSIPAMLIAGLLVFLAYNNPNLMIRLYVACGVMVGFLSHLVLDELCSVDFSGAIPTLNQFAGSALKFVSKSWPATLLTYSLLLGLGYLAMLDVEGRSGPAHSLKLQLPRMIADRLPQGTSGEKAK